MRTRAITVPYDSGHLRQRMGLGPERTLLELKVLFAEQGIQFESEEILLESAFPAEISATFELCRKVSKRVSECRREKIFPLVLSGNCNTALGSVSGCGNRTGVVWFDAHGESTTPETTTSGFLDGMGISMLLGRAWSALAKSVPEFVPITGNRILLFGARDIEPAERNLLESAGVLRADTVAQLAERLPPLAEQVDQIYVHIDLDVLDPDVAKANQWAAPNGISIENLLQAIDKVRSYRKIGALGIASYDPSIDRDGRALHAAVRVCQRLLSDTQVSIVTRRST